MCIVSIGGQLKRIQNDERMEVDMVLLMLWWNILVAINITGGVYYVTFGESWTSTKIVICALVPVGLFVWYKMRNTY